ncbi:hypothetical protein R3P38DRAFT_229456 [Favolaschia claudopus]|uniref:Uncharacterized protein n=1 Tax=Favolaschia claudopus TaxID=2862362 RepID=A0AAV9ZST4_9AGAR
MTRRAITSCYGKDAGTLRSRFVEGRYRASTSVPAYPSVMPRSVIHHRGRAHPRLSMPPPLWVSDHENGGILLSATATATTDLKLSVLCLAPRSASLCICDPFKPRHLPPRLWRLSCIIYTASGRSISTSRALPCAIVFGLPRACVRPRTCRAERLAVHADIPVPNYDEDCGYSAERRVAGAAFYCVPSVSTAAASIACARRLEVKLGRQNTFVSKVAEGLSDAARQDPSWAYCVVARRQRFMRPAV